MWRRLTGMQMSITGRLSSRINIASTKYWYLFISVTSVRPMEKHSSTQMKSFIPCILWHVVLTRHGPQMTSLIPVNVSKMLLSVIDYHCIRGEVCCAPWLRWHPCTPWRAQADPGLEPNQPSRPRRNSDLQLQCRGNLQQEKGQLWFDHIHAHLPQR